MAKPAAETVRKDTMLEIPSPRLPWGKNNLDIALGERTTVFTGDGAGKRRRVGGGGENGNGTKLAPESPGLYDKDGFLKSSPLKETEN